MTDNAAKAGELLEIHQGEYSDKWTIGFFVVLQEFKPMERLRAFLAENPEQAENYHFMSDAFLASLIRQGLLLEIEYKRLYLGAYGHAESCHF